MDNACCLWSPWEVPCSFGPWLHYCKRRQLSAKPRSLQSQTSKEKFQSIKTPPSYQESLARDWDRLSQDMLSVLMCKEQGPLVCLALQMAQQARVGTRSPLSRGPMAQALTSPLDSSLEPPAWAGKPELEGRWQQEFAPSKARSLTLGYKSG